MIIYGNYTIFLENIKRKGVPRYYLIKNGNIDDKIIYNNVLAKAKNHGLTGTDNCKKNLDILLVLL